MFRKKLTLLVIPDSQGTSKQVSVPVASIYLGVAAVLILLVATFFFSAQFFSGRVDQAELDQLKAENEALAKRFERIRWDLAEVDTRWDELVEKEVRIRTMFDLPDVGDEERQLGIGGPTPPALSRMTVSEKAAYQTEMEIDRLLRLSRFELEKYAEVEESLESLKGRLDHTPSIWPTPGWFSRGYGMQYDPFTGYKHMHRGIDIANKAGTPVVATADGRIKSIGRNGGLGKVIVIDHGYGFMTRYGHLSDYAVKSGQRVKRGDVVGYMGNTGYSTGPHLHYEVWRSGKVLNPREYILNEKFQKFQS